MLHLEDGTRDQLCPILTTRNFDLSFTYLADAPAVVSPPRVLQMRRLRVSIIEFSAMKSTMISTRIKDENDVRCTTGLWPVLKDDKAIVIQ